MHIWIHNALQCSLETPSACEAARDGATEGVGVKCTSGGSFPISSANTKLEFGTGLFWWSLTLSNSLFKDLETCGAFGQTFSGVGCKNRATLAAVFTHSCGLLPPLPLGDGGGTTDATLGTEITEALGRATGLAATSFGKAGTPALVAVGFAKGFPSPVSAKAGESEDGVDTCKQTVVFRLLNKTLSHALPFPLNRP